MGAALIRQLRRWWPDRALVVVADSPYAVLARLAAAAGLPQPVTVITRLRLEAALDDPAPPRAPGTRGGRASRASASRPWRNACSIRPRPGRR